ncbi:Hypothetical_protein [Hexamita inflata]|uniref:Hypothetical_protein n=1 Tax=Hexamita inflata TaxID=28002 RepID=A0AA86NMY0_9EUKA|nr:Hypothetical protein HINF_LOCUS10149 [Hexamita inflata]
MVLVPIISGVNNHHGSSYLNNWHTCKNYQMTHLIKITDRSSSPLITEATRLKQLDIYLLSHCFSLLLKLVRKSRLFQQLLTTLIQLLQQRECLKVRICNRF